MATPARLGLVVLAVDDLVTARDFYRRAFGWPTLVDAPVYAEFQLPDGMRLGLYRRENFANNTGELPDAIAPGRLAPTELYLYADDLRDAIARVEAAGARPLSGLAPRDWGDEVAYYADPAGNVLALAKPVAAR